MKFLHEFTLHLTLINELLVYYIFLNSINECQLNNISYTVLMFFSQRIIIHANHHLLACLGSKIDRITVTANGKTLSSMLSCPIYVIALDFLVCVRAYIIHLVASLYKLCLFINMFTCSVIIIYILFY